MPFLPSFLTFSFHLLLPFSLQINPHLPILIKIKQNQPYVTELDLRHSLIPDDLVEDLLASMPPHRGPDLQEDRNLPKYDYVNFMEKMTLGEDEQQQQVVGNGNEGNRSNGYGYGGGNGGGRRVSGNLA